MKKNKEPSSLFAKHCHANASGEMAPTLLGSVELWLGLLCNRYLKICFQKGFEVEFNKTGSLLLLNSFQYRLVFFVEAILNSMQL